MSNTIDLDKMEWNWDDLSGQIVFPPLPSLHFGQNEIIADSDSIPPRTSGKHFPEVENFASVPWTPRRPHPLWKMDHPEEKLKRFSDDLEQKMFFLYNFFYLEKLSDFFF